MSLLCPPVFLPVCPDEKKPKSTIDMLDALLGTEDEGQPKPKSETAVTVTPAGLSLPNHVVFKLPFIGHSIDIKTYLCFCRCSTFFRFCSHAACPDLGSLVSVWQIANLANSGKPGAVTPLLCWDHGTSLSPPPILPLGMHFPSCANPFWGYKLQPGLAV